MYGKIMVCLDGSRFAEKALPYAVEEAMKFGSKLVLLQVISPASLAQSAPAEIEAMGSYSVAPQLLKTAEQSAQQYLDSLTVSLKAGLPDVEKIVKMGNPGQIIVDYANENGIDHIAMSTHGSGGIKRALVGSVTDHVIRNSELPVLVIRPDDN